MGNSRSPGDAIPGQESVMQLYVDVLQNFQNFQRFQNFPSPHQKLRSRLDSVFKGYFSDVLFTFPEIRFSETTWKLLEFHFISHIFKKVVLLYVFIGFSYFSSPGHCVGRHALRPPPPPILNIKSDDFENRCFATQTSFCFATFHLYFSLFSLFTFSLALLTFQLSLVTLRVYLRTQRWRGMHNCRIITFP